MTGLLLVVCSMMLAQRLQTREQVGLGTWNLEIAVCCREESRMSSEFTV